MDLGPGHFLAYNWHMILCCVATSAISWAERFWKNLGGVSLFTGLALGRLVRFLLVIMGTMYTHIAAPGTIPFEFEESKFDPLFGFEETGRKLRTSNVTESEMDSCVLKDCQRDYCAKEYMVYRRCMYDHYPWFYKCEHEKHAWSNCQYQDYIVRMKEYEREKRLMERAKRVGPERAGYKVVPSES